jgi:hypothetical protein
VIIGFSSYSSQMASHATMKASVGVKDPLVFY